MAAVVRAPVLKSGGCQFKYRSDHLDEVVSWQDAHLFKLENGHLLCLLPVGIFKLIMSS